MAAPADRPAPEIWHIRGEGGDVLAHQLPLGEGLAGRLRAGSLLRVNEDGTPWVGASTPDTVPTTLSEKRALDELAQHGDEDGPALDRPSQADKKAVWVSYAVGTRTITRAAAEDLTKDELIERFGRAPVAADASPDTDPDPDAGADPDSES